MFHRNSGSNSVNYIPKTAWRTVSSPNLVSLFIFREKSQKRNHPSPHNHLMLYQRSSALFDEAYKYIPGGVNSPVRAFKSVGGVPIFMKSAKGAYMTDADDNTYIDYINSWGPA